MTERTRIQHIVRFILNKRSPRESARRDARNTGLDREQKSRIGCWIIHGSPGFPRDRQAKRARRVIKYVWRHTPRMLSTISLLRLPHASANVSTQRVDSFDSFINRFTLSIFGIFRQILEHRGGSGGTCPVMSGELKFKGCARSTTDLKKSGLKVSQLGFVTA